MADNNSAPNRRLVIRVGHDTLSFSTTEGGEVIYEPYPLNSSISVAANMREALQNVDMLREAYGRVLVMVDSPVLMIPVDLFDEELAEEQYFHAFTRQGMLTVRHTVLADLKSVAVFTVAKDLHTVLADRFGEVRYVAALTPVWSHLNQRSYTGMHGKLYAYVHEKRIDVFSFAQNRFKFCNSYAVHSPQDAVYYMLAAWKQLGLEPDHDELFLMGDMADSDALKQELKRFIKRVYVVNPAGEFNRVAVAQIPGIPYDLVTLYVKGL